jgi:hypothetical protein
MKKTSIALLVVCALIASTAPSFGETTDGAAIICDVLIARPVGLASMIVGTVMYVVALPFSIPSDSVGKTGQLLVEEPFKYTFFRPLGDFSYKAGMAETPKTGATK